MNDPESSFHIPPVVKALGGLIVAAVVTVFAWQATPSGELMLSTKILSPVGTGVLFVLGAWATWTYQLFRRDQKRERIGDALAKGRLICHCSETGEIMTFHHGAGRSIEVYACPRCTHMKIVEPRGEVLIADDTTFTPPLPRAVHKYWLQRSRNQRSVT